MQTLDPSVKQVLSPGKQKLFDDIDLQLVLGASTHIKMIGDMFLDIADRVSNPDERAAGVKGVADYFSATRGASSQAISNAIALMLSGMGPGAESLRASVERYRAGAEADMATIRKYLWSVLEGMKCILVFDYSSTVAAIASLARDHGVTLTCYVPESRGLDGGRPYVRPFLAEGHQVHFIPDSALYCYIPKCDAVFFGSETLYPDGTCFNTVGSELVGLLCREFKVPLYIPTPLIKLDMRAMRGYRKPPIMDDHTQRMSAHWESTERQGVDFTCPELVSVVPDYITAYITEEGILPPGAIYTAALAYQEKLRKEG